MPPFKVYTRMYAHTYVHVRVQVDAKPNTASHLLTHCPLPQMLLKQLPGLLDWTWELCRFHLPLRTEHTAHRGRSRAVEREVGPQAHLPQWSRRILGRTSVWPQRIYRSGGNSIMHQWGLNRHCEVGCSKYHNCTNVWGIKSHNVCARNTGSMPLAHVHWSRHAQYTEGGISTHANTMCHTYTTHNTH